jgi:hypothetical protein
MPSASLTRRPHLAHLVVGGAFYPVRRDDLRRDPAAAHRFEHVGIVVADEVAGDAAVDGQRVVEALVALDEFLDGDRRAVGETARAHRGGELVGACGAVGSGGAGGVARLQDHRKAVGAHEIRGLARAVDAGRDGGGHAGAAQHLLHRHLVAAEIGGAGRDAGNGAALADAGGGAGHAPRSPPPSGRSRPSSAPRARPIPDAARRSPT